MQTDFATLGPIHAVLLDKNICCFGLKIKVEAPSLSYYDDQTNHLDFYHLENNSL